MNVFALASLQGRWLAGRQAVIAENIANVNTPEYRVKDVAPFETVLDRTGLQVFRTDARHLNDVSAAGVEVKPIETESWETKHSGNNVSLEQELLKAGDIRRQHALNVNLTKTFHRFYLATLKG
jgi:flagellar basal-body rod protein FlgB